MGRTANTLPPGTVLGGKYQLVRLIGEGSMGAVYEAVQAGIGRRVALKTVAAGHVKNARRLGREAEAAGALNHPNIVQVSDVHIDPEGTSYLVMELLEGESLDAIARREPLSEERLLSMMRQVADALDAAHAAGIIHRDLKPANLFVTRTSALGEVVKVLDFGVAKLEDRRTQLTEAGNIVGTPLYMAPEQIRGASLGPQADLWSLGVVMYEVLAGATPFGAATWQDLLKTILLEDYAPLERVRAGLPAPLYAAVRQCLIKDPSARVQSARELDRLFASAQTQLGLESAPAKAVPSVAPSSTSRAKPTEVFGGHEDGAPITAELGAMNPGERTSTPASPLDLRAMLSTGEKDELRKGVETDQAATDPTVDIPSPRQLPAPPLWLYIACGAAFVVMVAVLVLVLVAD
ncbi:MAG: serine/threonine-protein kinase [Myxococcota bacterium]